MSDKTTLLIRTCNKFWIKRYFVRVQIILKSLTIKFKITHNSYVQKCNRHVLRANNNLKSHKGRGGFIVDEGPNILVL